MEQNQNGDQDVLAGQTKPETSNCESSAEAPDARYIFHGEARAPGSVFGIILADLNEVGVGAATAAVLYGVKKGADKLRSSKPHTDGAPGGGATEKTVSESGSAASSEANDG